MSGGQKLRAAGQRFDGSAAHHPLPFRQGADTKRTVHAPFVSQCGLGFRAVVVSRVEDCLVIKAGEALGVLEQDLGREEVLFVHQLLQEYFAARQLAKDPHPEFVTQEWRTDRITPGLAETVATLAPSDPLPPLPSSGWEETTVLASAMAEQSDRFITDVLAHRCLQLIQLKLDTIQRRDNNAADVHTFFAPRPQHSHTLT